MAVHERKGDGATGKFKRKDARHCVLDSFDDTRITWAKALNVELHDVHTQADRPSGHTIHTRTTESMRAVQTVDNRENESLHLTGHAIIFDTCR